MANISGKHISYWIDSTPTANFAQLSNNLSPGFLTSKKSGLMHSLSTQFYM
ncbi:hypothetical protein [Nostoc sp. NMS4]|uniref:hypothetical protein n=1 Tax=Nostoc sp. NMS4 TaxID=2815390 RepID=UPI0025FB9B4F|nr:hypothetical protein [Nostoc sp. NMS4]MBN3924181.1 hypothetical protein [Nostoc sp. NMS4]